MSTFPRPAAPESQNLFRFSLLLFVLASLYLAWPWLSGEVTIPWDSKAHFQPQLSFLAHALHDGQAPFWTPNVFAGMPQIADPQSLIFSPPFLLLAAFVREPTFQQADAVSFLMLTLGGIGWMLYFRDRGWSAAGGLVAALAFAYGGSAAWRIQHTGQILSLSWFPLAFWALNRALDRASFLWGMLAGLFAAFMVLGRDQIAWLFVLSLTVFVIWRFFAAPEGDKYSYASRLRRLIAPIGGGLIVGLVVAGPPLLWTIALAQQSNRAEITLDGAMRGSLHPASLLTALVANLYGIHGAQSQFWGPPSPDWGETGLYIARNMGEIYFGALPLMALLVFGVARGWIFDRSDALFRRRRRRDGDLRLRQIYAGLRRPVRRSGRQPVPPPGRRDLSALRLRRGDRRLLRQPRPRCAARAAVAGAGCGRRALPVVPRRRFRQGAFVRRAGAAGLFRGFRWPVAALARQGAALARKAGARPPAGRSVADLRSVAQQRAQPIHRPAAANL